MKTIIKLTLFLFAIALASLSSADQVGWHNQMFFQFGQGVTLNDEEHAKGNVAVMGTTPVSVPNSGGATETVTFAQHAFNMVSSLNVNSCVSLESFVYSGKVGVSFIDNQSFNDNTVNFEYTATRNFGTKVYPVLGFTPDFSNVVANLQESYQGEALHDAITSVFGTHVVTGYTSAATVSVLFSFNYASASEAQQLSVTAGGSVADLASFSTAVNSFFSNSATTQSMTYQFYSSDPNQSPTNFNFSTVGSIQSYGDFTNFVTAVEAYWRTMNPANAVITGYEFDPIQTLPGYLSLVVPYSPVAIFSPDYDDFLNAYAQLESWNQRLTSWTIDPKKMSWLNTQGQQMALGKRQDVANYIMAMNQIATNHFQTNGPLNVPEDIFNYLANLSDIPVPSIYVVYAESLPCNCNPNVPNCQLVIGWIDCGSQSLTVPVPFSTIGMYQNDVDIGESTVIDYSPSHFEQYVNSISTSCNGTSSFANGAFSSDAWLAISNAAATTERIGFYWEGQPDASEWSWVITDSEGNIVDQLNMLSTRSGSIGAPNQVQSAMVSLAAPGGVTTNAVGVAQAIPLTVTNLGTTPVYGITVSLALNTGFDFAGATGSQGFSSFDPSTRIITYEVGPLAAGANASIGLNLVPLTLGLSSPGSAVSLNVGDGLTNSLSASATVQLSSVATVLPVLNLLPVAQGIQLNWASDTADLILEQAPSLGTGSGWSAVTNTPVISGSQHFLSAPAAGTSEFFRLRTQ